MLSKNVCSVMAVTSAPVSTLHSVSWPSSRSVIFQLLSDSNAPRNVLSKSGSSAVVPFYCRRCCLAEALGTVVSLSIAFVAHSSTAGHVSPVA